MAGRPDEDIDLARAALYIAGQEFPDLDVDQYLGMLDLLGQEADRYIGQSDDLQTRIDLLSEFLFVDSGFHGNQDDYYDPNNSYLNQVLDRRTGIPITLSLVYMEVARRLGIVFEGIGLPGHFIMRTGPPEQELYVDAFNGGQRLSIADCQRLIENMFEGRMQFREEHLLPYSKKVFLERMLTNLKRSYHRMGDYRRSLSAADMITMIDPDSGSNLKERAGLYHALGLYRLAIRDLESYLSANPRAEDADSVRENIRRIWSSISKLN